MPQARFCAECGASLATDATGILCLKCALTAALEAGEEEAVTSLTASESPFGRIRYFGDYELLQEIGRGAMGVVFKARQVTLDRIVAVKVIRSGELANAADVERFRREAKSAGKLRHASIVSIHEIGECEGLHYFSMEYIEGKTLADMVREQPLPANRAAQFIRTIAEAIHHAHERGILHRDLKPSNVLLDLEEQPHVTDFGLAKTVEGDSDLTLGGQVLGTPSYMPPEQAAARHGEVGPHSDVYSLGAILYHLLTARPPFVGAARQEVLNQVINAQPPDPHLLNPSVPRDLETICLKCLAKEPQRRYGSAKELADELGRFQRGEPIHARPVGQAEKLRRWCRRHPAIAGLAAAVLALLTVVAIVSTVATVRIASARDAERRQRERADQVSATIELQRAEELFAADKASTALAHLARLLKANPTNRVAVERLMSALTHRNFALPVCPPLKPGSSESSAQFSPDGHWVITCATTAQVWDAGTGQTLGRPLEHGKWLHSAEFSPDGRRILTASPDKTARVWDALTGDPLAEPLRHSDEVRDAQFSPDGERIITASADKTARIWDAHTGQPLTLPLNHAKEVTFARFSPDGQRVITVSDGDQSTNAPHVSNVRIWDAHTGQPTTSPLPYEGGSCPRFSPDGGRLVTFGHAGRIWDTHTGEPLTATFRPGNGDLVGSAEFSPDGQWLVTAGGGAIVRIWDGRTGQPMGELPKQERRVWSAEFSPDGQRIITLSEDSTVRVWDASSRQPLTEPLRSAEGWATPRYLAPPQFCPDGERVITAGIGYFSIWDIRSGQLLVEPHQYAADGSVAPEFSSDGKRVATLSSNLSEVLVWDVCTGQLVGEPLKHDFPVDLLTVRFSPDGHRLVTVSGGDTAYIWEIRTGRPLTKALKHGGSLFYANFSPDGQRLVTIAAMHDPTPDHTVMIWDVNTGQPVSSPLKHQTTVEAAEFSPDGDKIATVSSRGTTRIWDARSGKLLVAPFECGFQFGSSLLYGITAQFSPDGQNLVVASGLRTIRIWDAHTGMPLPQAFKHEAGVTSAKFSSDGKRLLTTSEDWTAHLWDIGTAQSLIEPLRHMNEIWAAEFSADKERIVTGSRDGTVRIWDAHTGRPLTEPLEHESPVWGARFISDKQSLLTRTGRKRVRVWEMPVSPLPAPSWLPDLAEAVGGQRFNVQGVLEPVSSLELLRLKKQLQDNSSSEYYQRWVRWFFADRSTRTISPSSPMTVPEYVSRRIEEDTPESLREAVILSPTNGLAFARLARHLLTKQSPLDGRSLDEADFYSRRAVKSSPGDAEVQQVRQAVLREMEQARTR